MRALYDRQLGLLLGAARPFQGRETRRTETRLDRRHAWEYALPIVR